MRKLANHVRKISVILKQADYQIIERLAGQEKKTVSQFIRDELDIVLKNKSKSQKKGRKMAVFKKK